jgi:perosamine synthetase
MKVGIETRPVFYPVHTMPMYASKFQIFNIAENIGCRGINLPSWPGMADDEINFVIESIIKLT